VFTIRSRVIYTALIVLPASLVSSVGHGSPAAYTEPSYHLTRQLSVDRGEFDWVAIDPTQRRLYGVNYKVLDIDSLRVIGEVPLHTGHGFAIAPDLGRGLGRRGVIFDLKTLKLVTRVPATGDGNYYDPSTHRAFLLDNTTTVVDLKNGTVVGTISLKEDRYTSVKSAVVDGAGRLFVSIWNAPDTATQAASVIAVVDTHSLEITQRWSVPECFQARGLGFDQAAGRLFVSCEDSVEMLSASSGRLVAKVPVPGGAEEPAFDAAAQRFIVPIPDGRVAIVYRKHDDVYGVVTTEAIPGARDIVALDPITHRLFLPTQVGHSVGVAVLAPE
jgi:hypothetical protein